MDKSKKIKTQIAIRLATYSDVIIRDQYGDRLNHGQIFYLETEKGIYQYAKCINSKHKILEIADLVNKQLLYVPSVGVELIQAGPNDLKNDEGKLKVGLPIFILLQENPINIQPYVLNNYTNTMMIKNLLDQNKIYIQENEIIHILRNLEDN